MASLGRIPEATVEIAASSLSPVPTDCALSLVPTCTFDSANAWDLLCVPGGHGVADAMLDEALVSFIARQGKTARYVTSVCTGAFLLGVAGLLQGKRATTHWGYTQLLPRVGAK